ncbi:MAG: hypothetical protein V6Z82_04440 [Flavobacteriales bacterium]
MRKIRCGSLLISLLFTAASCHHDDDLSSGEQAAADQKAIQNYMGTHTYFFGRIRKIGDTTAGGEVPDEPFLKSDNTEKLPAGIWIWTKPNRERKGDKPAATASILIHYEGIWVKENNSLLIPNTKNKTGKIIPGGTLNNGTGRPIRIDLKDQAEPWWAEVMPHYRATDRSPEAPYEVQGVAFIPSKSGFGHRFIANMPQHAILVYEFEIYKVVKDDESGESR